MFAGVAALKRSQNHNRKNGDKMKFCVLINHVRPPWNFILAHEVLKFEIIFLKKLKLRYRSVSKVCDSADGASWELDTLSFELSPRG